MTQLVLLLANFIINRYLLGTTKNNRDDKVISQAILFVHTYPASKERYFPSCSRTDGTVENTVYTVVVWYIRSLLRPT